MEKRTLQDFFTALQVYASEERDCRMRTKNLKEALRGRKIAQALRKWKARKETTQKMRAFFKRAKFVKQ